MNIDNVEDTGYTQAMGHLLVLYTQVDQFIMEVCAERIACAPSQGARLGLAKQVGARLIIVNLTETHLDYLADVVIHADVVDILPRLAAAVDHYGV